MAPISKLVMLRSASDEASHFFNKDSSLRSPMPDRIPGQGRGDKVQEERCIYGSG